MKSRGMSGFGIIILIILLLLIGYVAYQLGRVHFTYGYISGKVENAARLGAGLTDYDIRTQLIRDAKEGNVELNPDSIFIDREIPDSLRIYVAYDDSSDIFGIFTYSRHLQVDKVVLIESRY